jgi:hypothetical protein
MLEKPANNEHYSILGSLSNYEEKTFVNVVPWTLTFKPYRQFSRYPNFDNWKNGSKKISTRLRTIFNNNNKDTLVKFDGLHSGRGYIEPRYYYK